MTEVESRLNCLLPRLRDRIEVAPDGCWLWMASKSRGYGQVMFNYRNLRAHRVVYEALVGPIPEGLDLDHLCRVRHCVNPDHLEPVTRQENLLRGETVTAAHAAQTHCKNGHEFTPENTAMDRGKRVCIICRKAYARARSARLSKTEKNRAYQREWARRRRAALRG